MTTKTTKRRVKTAREETPKAKRRPARRKGSGDFGPEGLRVPVATPGKADRKALGLKLGDAEPWKVRDHAGGLHDGRAALVEDDAGARLELRTWAEGAKRRAAWFAILPADAETPETGTRIGERYEVVAAPRRERRRAKVRQSGGTTEAPAAARGPRVFGKYSKSAVLRAMGLRGWKPGEAKAVLEGMGLVIGSTGPMGNRKTAAAELTEAEWKELDSYREVV